MNNNYKLILITIGFLALSSNKLAAQEGSLDKTFSTDGKVFTQISSFNELANAVAVQTNGKIVVVGTTNKGDFLTQNDFLVIRYNSDGSLDSTFSNDGIAATPLGPENDNAYAVAIQSNGKIIVAGSYQDGFIHKFAMVRFNSDGSLDNSFGLSGVVITQIGNNKDIIYDMTIQTNGKILVTGTSDNDFILARYNTNGSLDLTFNTVGWVRTDFNNGGDNAYAIALQANGKIIIGGSVFMMSTYHFGVARYDSTGALDFTFSGDGKANTNVGIDESAANDLALQKDGKVVLAGYMNNGSYLDFALVRFKLDGSLDSTFSGDGKLSHTIQASDAFANAISIQSDNKILAAGISTTATTNIFALVRYNSDGSFDNSFGTSGKVTTVIAGHDDGVSDMALQSDGKIILVGPGDDGTTDYGIVAARYNATASTAVKQIKMNGSTISVYPNPAEDFINLDFKLKQTESINVQLYDLQGKQVLPESGNTFYSPDGHTLTINLKSITSGIYNLVVMAGAEQQSFRIMVD